MKLYKLFFPVLLSLLFFNSCSDNLGLTMLKINSYQQTIEYTCGPAAVVSLLRYYNRTGDEMTIASEMGTSTTTGTTPQQMTSWLNLNGFLVSERNTRHFNK